MTVVDGHQDGADRGGGRRAVVIGAGVVGAAVAAELAMDGFAVTLVDKGQPGHGCSFGNLSGIASTEVVPQATPGTFRKVPRWLLDPLGPLTVRWRDALQLSPWLVRLLASAHSAKVEETASALSLLLTRSLGDFERLLATAGEPSLLGATDCLALYDTQREIAADTWAFELRARHGLPCTRVSGRDLHDLEPELADDFAGGWVYNGWRNVSDPLAVVTAFVSLAHQNGAKIRQGRVVELRTTDCLAHTVVLESGGTIPADLVVVSAGAWSGPIAKQLGDHIPLAAERGYHTMIPNPGISPKRAIIYTPQGFGITPVDAGLRIGGSVELAAIDTPPNRKRADILVKKASRVFPRLDASGANPEIWMGPRPATPDSKPVISRATSARNVIYAFGHGHLGLTLSATTARLVAGLASDENINIDLAPFDVARF